MNDASIRYELENIDNLRHLLCLVQELSGETGMQPVELEYHGYWIEYVKDDAYAVVKGAMTEEEYIARNCIAFPCQD